MARGRKALRAAAWCLLSMVATDAVAADRMQVAIGTGGQTGVYYEIGQAICRLVNRTAGPPSLRCTAPATGGSVDNINAVRAGQMALGLAQSDTQFEALEGNPPFAEQGPMPELRAVFSLHAEPVTIVARDDSGIVTLADLKGRRVNVGNPGSGARATFETLVAALGWQMDDFALAGEWNATEQAYAMCDGKVDAIVYTVGHPNGSITEATTACAAHLVPVVGDPVDRLLADHRYYAAATISAGTYPHMADDVTTFGVVATVVTSSAVDEMVVYGVVRAVFENIDRLQQMHPALAKLDPRQMISDALSAPLHPGAIRYYKERGWL